MQQRPRSVEDLVPGQTYSISRLGDFLLPRGRRLDEALRNDPLAPIPLPSLPGRHTAKDYMAVDLVSYIQATQSSEHEVPAQSSAHEVAAILYKHKQKHEAERGRQQQKHAAELSRLQQKHEAEMERERAARAPIEEMAASIAKSIVLESIKKHPSVRFKIKTERMAGVYFLMKGYEIIYIGQTTNLLARLGSHIGAFDFDNCHFVPLEGNDLNDMEGLMIRLIKPPLNGKRTGAPRSRWWDALQRFSLLYKDVRDLKKSS